MKALTVLQPYAAFIDAGQKTVECRTWRTDYRGDLMICAGARWADGDYMIPADKIDLYQRGVSLCVVELYDCVPFTKDHVDAAIMENVPDVPCYAWLLRNVRQIPEPFPVKGKQGFFNVDFSF
jgi:hypothetical protein